VPGCCLPGLRARYRLWNATLLARRDTVLLNGLQVIQTANAAPAARAGGAHICESTAPGVFRAPNVLVRTRSRNSGDVECGFVLVRLLVAVIDSGWFSARIAESIYARAGSRQPLPIRYVILTHMHPDQFWRNLSLRTQPRGRRHANLRGRCQEPARDLLRSFGPADWRADFLGTPGCDPD